MKRGFLIAVCGATIIVAGLAGCGGEKKTTTETTGTTTTTGRTTTSTTATATAGASQPMVTIDGQNQNVQGQVVCSTMGDTVNIAIGGAATGIGAVLSTANPPDVKSVGLGNVHGVTLGYTAGTGQGNAKATKDGSTYKITGTATGIDMANPMQPVTKPFEITVTCP